MDVLEKARELAEAVSADARCLRLQKARAAVETDGPIQEEMARFRAEKEELMALLREPPEDRGAVMEKQKKLAADYDALMARPAMAELQKAQNEINGLLVQINQMLQSTVSGEVGCGGDCAGCRGCGA